MIASRGFGSALQVGRALLSAGLLAFALGWSAHTGAQVAVPPLTGHVIDQTGTLTSQQKAALVGAQALKRQSYGDGVAAATAGCG